jgi:hypothetical protein
MLISIGALFIQVAQAGWLGVWSYDDCIKTYAVPAQTSLAVGAATRACRGIYQQEHKGVWKDRDNCVLSHILDAKAESASGTLVRTCRETYPVCKPNEAEHDNSCEVKCKEGETYWPADQSCYS